MRSIVDYYSYYRIDCQSQNDNQRLRAEILKEKSRYVYELLEFCYIKLGGRKSDFDLKVEISDRMIDVDVSKKGSIRFEYKKSGSFDFTYDSYIASIKSIHYTADTLGQLMALVGRWLAMLETRPK